MKIYAIKIFFLLVFVCSCSFVNNKNNANYQSYEKIEKFLPKDKSKQIKLKVHKAHLGDVNAQIGLANLYYIGQKEKNNPYDKRAAYYYRLASENGNPKAQFSLAKIYYNAYGVEKNVYKACFWAELSFMRGYKQAKIYKDMLEKKYASKICTKAKKNALLWKKNNKIDYISLMKEYGVTTIAHEVEL